MASGALYPGTFDPFTKGHEEIVRRAVRLFDRVVVAVAASPSKTPAFTLDERTAMIAEVIADLDTVTVLPYTGLTVDVAREHGLQAVIRGLRAVSDFEYEFQLATMNRHLNQDIETVFLTPSEQYMFVSASLVREIAVLGGNVAEFVHPAVLKALQRRYPQS